VNCFDISNYFRQIFIFLRKSIPKIITFSRIKIENPLKIKQKSEFFNANYAKFSKNIERLIAET